MTPDVIARSVLYVCAVRYAIGRSTYMPDLVGDLVIRDVDLITPNDRKVIVRDIDYELGIRAHGPDVARWRLVRAALTAADDGGPR